MPTLYNRGMRPAIESSQAGGPAKHRQLTTDLEDANAELIAPATPENAKLGRRLRHGIDPQSIAVAVAGGLLLSLIALPIIALLLRVPAGSVLDYLSRPLVVEALRLSLLTTLLSTIVAVVLGTPLAYALARRSFPGKQLVDALVTIPLVLPPAVAGVALLMAFGRRGLFGGLLGAVGVELAFSTAAVVVAQTFIATPFFVRSAQAGFSQVDPSLEALSATLGIGSLRTFWRVTLPLALPALVSGVAMAWARALGEFGATIMFAGSFVGRSQTMPLAVYAALQSDLDAAAVLSAILVVFSFAVLATLYLLTDRRVVR